MLENFKKFRRYYAEVAKKIGEGEELAQNKGKITSTTQGFPLLSEFFNKLEALNITEEDLKKDLFVKNGDDIDVDIAKIDIKDEKFGFIREFYEFCSQQEANEYIEFSYISDSHQTNLKTDTYNSLNYLHIMLMHIATIETPLNRKFAFKVLQTLHENFITTNRIEDHIKERSFNDESERTPILPVLTAATIPLLVHQADLIGLVAGLFDKDNSYPQNLQLKNLVRDGSTYISRKNNMLAVEAYLRSQDLTPEQKVEILSHFLMVKTNLKPGNLSKEREEQIISDFLAANTDVKAEDLSLSKKDKIISNFLAANTDIKAEDLSPAFKDKILSDFLADRSWIEWSKLPEAQKDQIISDFFQNSDIEVTPENLSGACKERVIRESTQAALGHKLFPQEKEEIISNFLKSKPGIEDLSLAFKEKLVSNYLAKNSKAEFNKLSEEQKDKIIADFLRAENNKVNAGNVQVLLQNPETLEFICNYTSQNPTRQSVECFVKLINFLPEEQQALKDKLFKQVEAICNYIIEQKDQYDTLLPCFFPLVKELYKNDEGIAKQLCDKLDGQDRLYSTYEILFADKVRIEFGIDDENSFNKFVLIIKALEFTKETPKEIHLNLGLNSPEDNNPNPYAERFFALLFKTLKENPNIKEVNLRENDLKDNNIFNELTEALKANKNIHTLYLTSTEIGDDQAKILLEALSETGVQYLDLSHNSNIGKNTATLLAKILANNSTSLTYLDIQNTDIKDDGINELMSSLQTNNNITKLSFNADRKKEIAYCKNIVKNILSNPARTQSISIKMSDISSDVIKPYQDIIYKYFALKQNPPVTQVKLDFLDLDHSVFARMAEVIGNNNHIENLTLKFKVIGDEEVASLVKLIENNKSIKTLDIEGEISSENLQKLAKALENNTNILNFYLSKVQVEESDVNALNELLKKNITLQNISFFRGWATIPTEASLTIAKTILSNNERANMITVHGLDTRNIGNVITDYFQIKKGEVPIIIIGSEFLPSDPDIIKSIFEALKTNKTVKTLVLNNRKKSDNNFSVRMLAELIDTNQTIEDITIYHTKITLEEAKLLADSIKNSKTIKNLSIKYCDITEGGVEFLAEAFGNNTSITKIEFENNKIDEAGIKAIAKALENNSTLEEFKMFGYDDITPETKTLLFKSIFSNKNRQKALTIPGILSYESEFIEEYFRIRENNPHKEYVTLKSDFVKNKPEQRDYIFEALRSNNTVHTISLEPEAIEEENTLTFIAELLRTKNNITSLSFSSLAWGYVYHKVDKQSSNVLTEAILSNEARNNRLKIGMKLDGYSENIIENYFKIKLNEQVESIDLTLAEEQCGMLKHIARELAKNTKLLKLNISLYHDKIQKDDIDVLVNALRTNATLNVLNIKTSDNNIDSLKTMFPQELMNRIQINGKAVVIEPEVVDQSAHHEKPKEEIVEPVTSNESEQQKTENLSATDQAQSIPLEPKDEPQAPKAIITPQVPSVKKDYTEIANLIIKGKTQNFASRVYANDQSKTELSTLLAEKFAERVNLHATLNALQTDEDKQKFASKVLSAMSEVDFQGSAAFRNIGKDKAGWKNTFVDLILALCDCITNFSTQPFKDWQQGSVKLVVKDEAKFMSVLKGEAKKKENPADRSNFDKFISTLEKQQSQTISK